LFDIADEAAADAGTTMSLPYLHPVPAQPAPYGLKAAVTRGPEPPPPEVEVPSCAEELAVTERMRIEASVVRCMGSLRK